MKQITMDFDLYQDELKKERQEGAVRGYNNGRADTVNDISVIKELVDGDDPHQALQYINASFEGEQRELLIKIFGLEAEKEQEG